MKTTHLALFGLIASLRLVSAQTPTITSPPNNETVYAGGGVSFQVAASGSPLYYFWQRNGVSLTNNARISGANSAVLTITNASANDAGQYSCIVSNAAGAPTSATATLTVNPLPPGLLYTETFPTPEVPSGSGFYPVSNVGWNCNGGELGLWSSSSGTSPAYFYSGGAGTTVFYTTTALDNGVSGLPFPSINVGSGPSLTLGANLVTYNANTTAYFIVQMNGGSWYVSAASLPLRQSQAFAPAATNWNTFNINTGTVGGQATSGLTGSLTGAGLFINYPDGENGSLDSFTINQDTAPTVTVPPTSQSVYAGGTVSFQVSASGSPLNYFWQLNGVGLTNNGRIFGANEPVLTITGAAANDAGQYSCIVSNFLGTDNSANHAITTLMVDPAPAGPPVDTITVSTGVVLNTFSPDLPKPIGINMNFFTDNDLFLNPARPIADALKEMGVKYLRYPGGGKSDYYFFAYPPFDSVAPHSPQSGPGSNAARAQFFNADGTAFNRVVLDFDEYMAICKEVGAEPVVDVAFDTYIMTPDKIPGATTNTNTSTLREYYTNAVEWVRYANVKKSYGVKYWMLGNETWNAYYQDDNGNWYGIPESDLIQNINSFSAGMKAVDPSIKVIMNGVDWLVSEYVTACSNSYDYICTSEYPLASVPITSYDDWATNRYDLVSIMQSIVNVIDGSSLSAAQKQSTKIWASEFGPYTWWSGTWPSGQDVGHSMFNFDILGQELCNPRFGVAMLWTTRWMGQGQYSFYDALDDNNNLTSNGQSLALWGNYLLAQMVQVSQASGLTVYASYDPAGGQAYCYIINKTASARDVHLQFDYGPACSVVRKAWMQGLSAYAASSAYSLNDSTLSSSNVTVIPYSITVFQMSVAQMVPPTTLGGIAAGASSGNSLTLNWTASGNVHLQSATSLAPPVVWTDVPNTTGQGSATITTTNIQMFFRLIQP
jgi:hypothetical protein